MPAGTSIISRSTYTFAQIETRLRLGQDHDFAWWGYEENPNSSNNFIVFEGRFQQGHAWKISLGKELVVLIHKHPPAVMFKAPVCKRCILHFNATQRLDGVYVEITDPEHDLRN